MIVFLLQNLKRIIEVLGFAPTLVYQFMRAFPKNVTSVPVAYGQSEFTKVTVEFAYDRYIVNPAKEKAETKPGYIPGAPSQELVREDLAIKALTNREMINSVGTDAQKRILVDADSRYPLGSRKSKDLKEESSIIWNLCSTRCNRSNRETVWKKSSCRWINKINKGFGAKPQWQKIENQL